MSLNTDSPDAKKPCKGILKSSSSFDKHTPSAAASSHRKSAKFDELNVLQTYHPPDKDYGHMKVDEPKTPYNYVEHTDVDQLDAELLAEKLRVAAHSRSASVSEEDEESPEEEEELTEEQKKQKLEFARRRKAHYNEFEAVRLARKLIEEEDEDDEEDGDDASNSQGAKSSKSKDLQQMDVEDQDEVDRKSADGASSQQAASIQAKEADEV
ncbi:protein phosphatase inhibitor 2 isoform X2 [Toxorhynchites rutilus septentrionalis]|uniref:protein phosphatase inhibitor 2 isoform X2 n=1 Tax=Toxorhynchites rutilus septentrionalis TaxID=329112 RepID=UPI002478C5D4|nr:protein phosphatase inhibitor 2 isoform X2 [Toxorhynchites rutilus septentrionalis]